MWQCLLAHLAFKSNVVIDMVGFKPTSFLLAYHCSLFSKCPFVLPSSIFLSSKEQMSNKWEIQQNDKCNSIGGLKIQTEGGFSF